MVFCKVDDFALSASISYAPTISGLAMPGGDVIVKLTVELLYRVAKSMASFLHRHMLHRNRLAGTFFLIFKPVPWNPFFYAHNTPPIF
jgi:hypothetical protein